MIMNDAQTVLELSELKAKFQHAVRHGYFWCSACSRIVDRKNDGEAYNGCEHCGSRRVVWKEPIIPHDTPI